MKIKVTLVDTNGSFVAEVRAPAETALGFFPASPTPQVVIWRERAFIRIPYEGGRGQRPRIYREATMSTAAHRAVR